MGWRIHKTIIEERGALTRQVYTRIYFLEEFFLNKIAAAVRTGAVDKTKHS